MESAEAETAGETLRLLVAGELGLGLAGVLALHPGERRQNSDQRCHERCNQELPAAPSRSAFGVGRAPLLDLADLLLFGPGGQAGVEELVLRRPQAHRRRVRPRRDRVEPPALQKEVGRFAGGRPGVHLDRRGGGGCAGRRVRPRSTRAALAHSVSSASWEISTVGPRVTGSRSKLSSRCRPNVSSTRCTRPRWSSSSTSATSAVAGSRCTGAVVVEADESQEHVPGRLRCFGPEPAEQRVGPPRQRARDAAAGPVGGDRDRSADPGIEQLGQRVLQQRQRPGAVDDLADHLGHDEGVDVDADLGGRAGDGRLELVDRHRRDHLGAVAEQLAEAAVAQAGGRRSRPAT